MSSNAPHRNSFVLQIQNRTGYSTASIRISSFEFHRFRASSMSTRLLRTDRWSWSHVVAAVAMAALGIAVTWPSWADIYHIATTDEEADHVLLVPLVVCGCFGPGGCGFAIANPVLRCWGRSLWLLAGSSGRSGSTRALCRSGMAARCLIVLGCVVSVLGKHAICDFCRGGGAGVPGSGARRDSVAGGDPAAKLDRADRAAAVCRAEHRRNPVR